eukprot:217030_1
MIAQCIKKYISDRKKNNLKESSDEFIIRYNKTNQPFNSNSIDTRRVVFISLLGLYQSWRSCPTHTLYSAIFMLPLKRNAIYYSEKYLQERQTSLLSELSMFHSDVEALRLFIELIKWKDSQQLVFWMLDDYEPTKNKDPLIGPFWYCFNQKITNLYDPITRKNYKSLNLNCEYWRKDNNKLSELYFKTMKFKTMKEILYKSNPSLHVIKAYGECEPVQFTCMSSLLLDDNDKQSNSENESNDWWISDLYDPYDI